MTRRSLILLAAGGSFVLLAAAYGFQAAGYAPCQMCLWQRWPHGVAVALGAVGALAPFAVVAVLGAAAALITGGIGVYHAGVEQQWWEGPASCSGAGGGLTGLSGSDLLNPTLANPVVMCDDIVWSLFGLSMAGWNALFSFMLAAVWIAAWRRTT